MNPNDFGRYCLYACPFLSALLFALWVKSKARVDLVREQRDRAYEAAKDLSGRLADAEEAKRRAERAYEALLNSPLQVCPRAACGAETKQVTICPVCQVEGCVERCVPRGGPCVQCASEGVSGDEEDPLDDLESGIGPGPTEPKTRKGPQRSGL